MCHHLVEGLSDGLDMWYGVRSAWWNAELAAQPQGFCKLANVANPVNKSRLAAIDRMRLHGWVEERRGNVAALVAELEHRGGILAELSRIVAMRPGVRV